MAQDEVAQLIERLRDFRQRSQAMRRLISMGREAALPLAEALASETQEGARWAMLRCLGEMRAVEAVPHIAALLADAGARAAAREALVRIVGSDLGESAEPWVKWARQHGAASAGPAAAEPELHMTGMPDQRLLELALRGCEASWHEESPGRYCVEVALEGGAPSQRVHVNLAARDHEGAPIAIVHADCGPACAEHYEKALRWNLRMPYGALAVHESGGRARFVMFNTLLREDMSPLELRKSILVVARRAARVRRELVGETEDA